MTQTQLLPAPSASFQRDLCRQRNRIAARRDGVDAVGIRLGSEKVDLFAEQGFLAEKLAMTMGALPPTETEALSLINAGRVGEEPLKLSDVWIHYAEAASTNFIPDRFLFLDKTTLRNIAQDAASGIAFMNSHRTGGMSHPTELPYGRSFAGRYEESGDGRARAIVGLYMLRGVRPNGDSGPSTDELHTMIDGGTLFDVSVGLFLGQRVCDVCAADVGDWDGDDEGAEGCRHVPGTARAMKPAQREAQEARGVPSGFASYTLVGARMNELSGVYDGAVPGAGFRKALSLVRAGALDLQTLRECRKAYEGLLKPSDLMERPENLAALPAADLAANVASLLCEDAPPAGATFAAELDAALAAVTGCIERAKQIEKVRAEEGRTLGRERVAQLCGLSLEIDHLLERLEKVSTPPSPPPFNLARLQRETLRLRTEMYALEGI